MRSFAVLLVCVAVVCCKPATEAEDNDVFGSVVKVFKNCDDPESCLKEKAMRYVENLASSRDLDIVDGISIIGTGSARGARSYDPLPEEPKARASTIEGRIIDGVADFLENHVVQLRMPKSTIEDVKRSLEEGRGKKKKLKQLLPIYALIQLKLQALIPLFLAIIAFAAVKGLFLAKAAVIASALLLLKKLLSKGESHESYEVVAHPHHEEHHSGGGHGGGWGRSDAQSMAYNAYAD